MSVLFLPRDGWHAANYGASKRNWFVCKGNRPDFYYEDRRGNVRKYASQEAATKIAIRLNRAAQ